MAIETSAAAPAAPASPPTPSERFVDSYDTGTGEFDEITGVTPEESSSSSASAEPTAEVVTPQSVTPQASSLPPSLVRRAKENAGFDDDEISSMPREVLEAAVSKIEQQIIRQNRENRRDASVTGQNNAQSAQVPPVGLTSATASPADAPAAPEADPFADFNAGDYDEMVGKLVGEIRTLRAEMKELRELKGFKQEYQQDKIARRDQSFSEVCDEFFAKDQDYFGEGGYRTITKGSAEMTRRHMLILAAKSINENIPWGEKMERAYEALRGTSLSTVTPGSPPATNGRKQVSKDPATGRFISPAEFAAASMARPNQRSIDEDNLPRGREKAIQTAARLMKQRSEMVSHGDTDEANADDFL